MDKTKFEQAIQAIQAAGFPVVDSHTEYDWQVPGNWVITANTSPRQRLTWSALNNQLHVDVETKGDFAGAYSWKTTWSLTDPGSDGIQVAIGTFQPPAVTQPMSKLQKQIGFICAVLVIGLVWVYMTHGTLSPCGVLRSGLQQEARKDGGILGAIVSMTPDGVADAILEDMYGPLTPARCLGLLLKTPEARERVARESRSQPAPAVKTQPAPVCQTRECLLFDGAEVLARQAFDLCRRADGRSTGAPYSLNDPCLDKALKAWFSTGAMPPYAHACTVPGAKVDFLGRCL